MTYIWLINIITDKLGTKWREHKQVKYMGPVLMGLMWAGVTLGKVIATRVSDVWLSQRFVNWDCQ
jgi:hypothetical protein